MLPKGQHIDELPVELKNLLEHDKEAREFYESLTKSCKRAYCDWVGSAKQEPTRQSRAEKALAMLQNKQKTLKIVK